MAIINKAAMNIVDHVFLLQVGTCSVYFMMSHLLILDLKAQANGVLFRKFSSVPISLRLFPTFPSISFTVSVLLEMLSLCPISLGVLWLHFH